MLAEKIELGRTQEQILDAAIRCVKQLGIDRVTLNDIAKESKLARSTVYSHYANRDEVVRFALLQSAYGFAEKVITHLMTVPEGAERIIEAVVFSMQALPDEPCLALITDERMSQMVNEHTLTTEAGFAILTDIYRFLRGDADLSEAALSDEAEMALRTMLSLLTLRGPAERGEDETRRYVARWLLPALRLEIPADYR